MKRIVVHYVPTCAFSAGTVMFMFLRGAEMSLVNLDLHQDERERLQKKLGEKKLETPTLEVDGELHVAPSLSDLKKLLVAWGLPESVAPHAKAA